MNAGRTATQRTALMSFAHNAMNAMARSGPRNAPTESSDWRSPYAAPRKSGGVMSATKASRGAPRIPLPTRSVKRALERLPYYGVFDFMAFGVDRGTVTLRVSLSAVGDVLDVAIARSSGSRLLDRAAQDAVRTWRFLP